MKVLALPERLFWWYIWPLSNVFLSNLMVASVHQFPGAAVTAPSKVGAPSTLSAAEIAKNILTGVTQLLSPDQFNANKFIDNYIEFCLATRREVANGTFYATPISGEILKVLETVVPRSDPSLKAMRTLASVLDQNQKPLLENDYHNIPHYYDVHLFGTVLAVLNRKFPNYGLENGREMPLLWRLTAIDVGDSGMATQKHDIFHTGGPNGLRLVKKWVWNVVNRKPIATEPAEEPHYFRHERRSWLKAKPILIAAGFQGARLLRQHVMVLITDPMVGPPLVRTALRYHFAANEIDQKKILKEGEAMIAEQFGNNRLIKKLFEKLIENPKTVIMCDILNKADTELSILPKMIGVTSNWLNKENKKNKAFPITDDNGNPLPNAMGFFFGHVVGLNDQRMMPWAELLCGALCRKTAEMLSVPVAHANPNQPQAIWGKPTAQLNR